MDTVLIEIAALVAMVALVFIQLALLAPLLTWAISAVLDVPFVPTPHSAFAKIIEALHIQEGDVVYELGGGDGRFMLACARRYPTAHFVGVERNPLLHTYALLRRRFAGMPSNLEFRRDNFFHTNLSRATKIYCYLLPSVMDKLLPKFERELRNARVASRAFQFSAKQPVKIVEVSKKPGSHGQHLLYVYDFS